MAIDEPQRVVMEIETRLRLRALRCRMWSNDGREMVRLVDRETVPARLLEDLQPGTAWLRVPPVDRKRASSGIRHICPKTSV